MSNITIRLTDTVEGFVTQHAPDVNWLKQTTPGIWSAKEILGHLTDSAYINLQRLVRCTYESNFTITYAQDEWVAAQHYNNADIVELLTLWHLINKRIVVLLKNYPADCWLSICNNQTVEFLAEDYLDHMVHHLDQIIAR